MLTIVCGEDTVTSRNAYRELCDKNKDAGLQYVDDGTLVATLQDSTSLNSLFGETSVFASEHLVKKSKRNKRLAEILKKAATQDEVHIIDWEGMSARDMNWKEGTIVEKKPSVSIFSWLDTMSPGYKLKVIQDLQKLMETQDEFVVMSLLYKHIRNLLIVAKGNTPPGLAGWQAGKLKSQAKAWPEERLQRFMEMLITIDRREKTSSSPLSMQEELEIALSLVL